MLNFLILIIVLRSSDRMPLSLENITEVFRTMEHDRDIDIDIHIYIYIYMGFLGGSDGKASARNVGGPGSIPRSGRSPGEGNSNPLSTLA